MQQENILDLFNQKINSFYSSRLIIIDKQISELLQILVSKEEYLKIVVESAEAYDYSIELKNATSSETTLMFTMPHSRRKIVSLVTGLLYEFDNKTKNVVDFITSFYPAETTHASYIKFLDNIISPFAHAFTMLITTENDVLEVVADKPIQNLNDLAKEQCGYWLTQLSDTLLANNKIDEQTRDDALELIRGLYYVLELQDANLIKYVWIGLKNVLREDKSCVREMQEINSMLFNFGLIDSGK